MYFLSHDEIRVANWSEPERASGRTAGQQLAERGHSQVLADSDAPPERIRNWLDAGKDHTKSLSGVMYSTWQSNFTDLETFATAAWGGAE